MPTFTRDRYHFLEIRIPREKGMLICNIRVFFCTFLTFIKVF